MSDSLYFRFKGSRNYVHGSDIFDLLEQAFAQEGRHVIGLTFRHFSRHQPVVVTHDPGVAATTEGVALERDGTRSSFWLVETEEQLTERYPFDEDAITVAARIQNDTISADGLSKYSIIEQVIALTKALNYWRAPNVDGKWVFGQLRLVEPLPLAAESYRIRQKVLLANRFSTQDIFLDGKHYGEIRFITGKP